MDRHRPACAIASTRCAWTWFPAETTRCVGAGLPAKIVNDDAGCLGERGVWAFFAGRPAPTGRMLGYQFGQLYCVQLNCSLCLSSLLLEALS
ncbi:hypothetical protein FIV37_18905 [Pseudomonas gessardii]|nr:hypothetical protein [Pseudomonas gessardii]